MLTIRQIFQKDYPQGKIVSYKYTSNKYYDVSIKKRKQVGKSLWKKKN